MSHLVLYSGRVLQLKRWHQWKESFMSLQKDGTLTWYRKDGYQVKASIDLPDALHRVKLETPDEKHHEKLNCTPFFMVIPIKRDQNDKITTKRFAVMSGADLLLWLDAFATVVGDWKCFKTIRERHMQELATSKQVGVDAVESSVSYQELVYYFKAIWEDYMQQRIRDKRSKDANDANSGRSSECESDHVTTSEDEAVIDLQ